MKNLIILAGILNGAAFANEALESLGERLFNDIRFSEASEVSCSSCHMVDQGIEQNLGGMRGYNDYFSLSEIPLREDGKNQTLRNTPSLVGIASKYAKNRFSHHDGEFIDHSKTVLGNFTGRNMGWLVSEKERALKNIINIIKSDDGLSDLAMEFGGPYKRVFLAIDPALPDELRLPTDMALDVNIASKEEILDLVTKAVNGYMNSLDFEKDKDNIYIGSTYDDFLRANFLPLGPDDGENTTEYSLILMKALADLKKPVFIQEKYLATHKKTFKFKESEWRGLKLFFNLSGIKKTSRGTCIQCHTPPLFTDQEFHNIGVAQIEYENIHGPESFIKIKIPSFDKRSAEKYFLKRPVKDNKKAVDLGMWNFFGRKGKEALTQYFKKFICAKDIDCTTGNILPMAIGRFKTPTLRNLNHSAPYFHTGKAKRLEDVLDHYSVVAKLFQENKLINGAPQIKMMTLNDQDKMDLKAFLDTLNSEYD